MLPYIDLGFTRISLYGPIFLLGFALAMIIIRVIAKETPVERSHLLYAAIYGLIGLAIGAKVLFFFTRLPSIIQNWDDYVKIFKADYETALDIAFGGLVFYGGLIGFALGVIRYSVHFKVDLFDLTDLYSPFLPFAHAFGRIGCFLSGCCYGIEYHGPFSVQFPYNEISPELSEVPRFPVQLLEALLNFICFGVLLMILLKAIKQKPDERKLKKGQLLGYYLAYYIVARTGLEFLRGDVVRGKIGILSTSQIISILLIPVAAVLIKAHNRAVVFYKSEEKLIN
ncbi:MAG: prolipoprotein diacylglyceryl transferase [Lachnospiraceae bacterium]|nr:prolipoprotein diacylglyceryl transferase [Lachnospiraceae bacterium]